MTSADHTETDHEGTELARVLASMAGPPGAIRERIVTALGAVYGQAPRYNPETRRYDREPTPEEVADSSMWVRFNDPDNGGTGLRGATIAEVADAITGAFASPSAAPAGPSAATTRAAWGGGEDGPESSGVALIAAERARQVTAKGYTPEHDAHHGDGDLIRAAVAYATLAAGATEEHTAAWWPWDRSGFKPGDGRLRALVKAGALIAAEIDRLIDNG